MKELSITVRCDGSPTCKDTVEFEDFRIGFGPARDVTVDLCAKHKNAFENALSGALKNGVQVTRPYKKNRKAAPAPTGRECGYCGVKLKSTAGLAQHLKHKHKKSVVQHDVAVARKTASADAVTA